MKKATPAIDRLLDILTVRDVRDLIREVLAKLPLSPTTVEVLTYPDIVRYTVDHAPPNLDITQCLVMRQTHPKGFLIVQAFASASGEPLRDNDGVVYGRRIVAASLDAELSELFGSKDLLILK